MRQSSANSAAEIAALELSIALHVPVERAGWRSGGRLPRVLAAAAAHRSPRGALQRGRDEVAEQRRRDARGGT